MSPNSNMIVDSSLPPECNPEKRLSDSELKADKQDGRQGEAIRLRAGNAAKITLTNRDIVDVKPEFVEADPAPDHDIEETASQTGSICSSSSLSSTRTIFDTAVIHEALLEKILQLDHRKGELQANAELYKTQVQKMECQQNTRRGINETFADMKTNMIKMIDEGVIEDIARCDAEIAILERAIDHLDNGNWL